MKTINPTQSLMLLLAGALFALIPALSTAEEPNAEDLVNGTIQELCDRGIVIPECEDGGGGDGAGDDGSGGSDDGNGGGDGGSGGGSGDGSSNPDDVTITLRTPAGVVVSDDFELPGLLDGDVAVTPTAGGDPIDVDAQSALAILITFDEESDDFAITDLQYFSSFGSFFLNCIEVSGSEQCGSWQYTVEGQYPSVGLDKYELDEGDHMYLFFGSPRKVSIESAQVLVNTPITATVMEYDPERGEYMAAEDYTIGLLQGDPSTPTVLETLAVDGDGQATFTVDTTGDYLFGIEEDFYFPTTPFTVVTALSSAGGGGILEDPEFDVPAALAFIVTAQEDDGSFGSSMYTDWAAIALAAGSEDGALEKVRSYLANDDTDLERVTDYERRAMALMSLGINPYNGTETNLIAGILSYYDGEQIGDAEYVNDDVFGLIVLERAGYDTDDEVMQKVASFVLAEQKDDGSWEGSVDLTAAAIQALMSLTGISGVPESLANAKVYLKEQQESDAGFGSSFATSWVLQAIAALGQTSEAWEQGGDTPFTYLAHKQRPDGGVEEADTAAEIRLWATSYAVPAALGMTWREIMSSFSKTGEAAVDDADTSTTGGSSAAASTGGSSAASAGAQAGGAAQQGGAGADLALAQEGVGATAATDEEGDVEGEAKEMTEETEGEAVEAKGTGDDQLAAAAEADGEAINWLLKLLGALVLLGVAWFVLRRIWMRA